MQVFKVDAKRALFVSKFIEMIEISRKLLKDLVKARAIFAIPGILVSSSGCILHNANACRFRAVLAKIYHFCAAYN